MTLPRFIARPITFAVMLSLAACVATVRPRAGVVYVHAAPPPRVEEVITVAPSPDHVWIPGHHEWRGEAYVWVGGRYERRPEGRRTWEPGRWVETRNGWYWEEGRWR